MMRRTLRFEAPAEPVTLRQGGSRDVREDREWAARTLRANPGRWALLGRWPGGDTSRQHAFLIRNGGPGWRMFGAGFEVQAHTMLGEFRIYARYVGETDGAA